MTETAGTSGIISIDKPQNYTSFDCVAILRRAAGTKKIGHTGTLDPMATGVLACCIGNATRILEYLEDDVKEYCGTLKLGLVTETDDIWGDVIACKEVFVRPDEEAKSPCAAPVEAILTAQQVRDAFAAFTGFLEQVPPRYAAIKINGRKLYEYAREGRPVEAPARPVTIHELDILDIREDEVDFRTVCSKGTYIRSLCRDIGEKLGVGGTMTALRRTRTGMCAIENSVPIEAVKEMDAAQLAPHLIPIDRALAGYPRVDLNRARGLDFLNGKLLAEIAAPVTEAGDKMPQIVPTIRTRVYGEERFLGMADYDPAAKTLKPHKVFASHLKDEWR